MQTDYIIVGQGIAGTVLGHTLLKKKYTIAVIDDAAPNSASRVAGGLYNPVTGKRMTRTWKASELFPFMESFYKEFEKTYSCQILFPKSIYKPFANEEERSTWLGAHDETDLIITDLPPDKYSQYLDPAFHFGGFETKLSGHLKVPEMLTAFRNFLLSKNSLLEERFDPSRLIVSEKGVQYGELKAASIIFCEGVNATLNPWFSWLPFAPSKGETIKVNIHNFTEEAILNKQVFIIPLGNHQYRVGSTYQWVFDSDQPTEKGREELSTKLSSMIRQPFEIAEHKAGIRPSVKDRKPIVGFHPVYRSLAIFNGLGTKGISLAPYFAENFTDHLSGTKQLFPEVNIERFYSLYSRSEL